MRRHGATLTLTLSLVLLAVGYCASVAHAEEANAEANFTCSAVTYSFTGFPNMPNNTVKEVIRANNTIIATRIFQFNGPTGSNTVKISAPQGADRLDAEVSWRTNGVRGGRDISKGGHITCGPEYGLAVQKLQKYASSNKYSAVTLLLGHVGETVDYEIFVTNTGNVPLTLVEIADSYCDAGTLTGGPGAKPLEYAQSTTYFCSHVLTEADLTAGSVTNTATVTGDPPEGEPLTTTSNPVVVNLPNPGNTDEFTCPSVTFTFTGFPDLPRNRVAEKVRVDGKTVYSGIFVFDGSSGSNTVPLSLTPGHHKVDGSAKWKVYGFKGGDDISIGGNVFC